VTSLKIDQSIISICDMKKMLGGEAKQNLLDSAYSLCYLFDIYQQKLNIVINFTFLPFFPALIKEALGVVTEPLITSLF
jgi:hypothetical protein